MKVLLFANTDWYLFNFRLSLANALSEKGVEVVLLSPPGEYVNRLKEGGFRWVEIPMSRGGINPFSEFRTFFKLWKLYRSEKPDLVHHYTIKCVLYGSLAAHFTGVKSIINSITGLGFVFTGNTVIHRILRNVVSLAYRLVLSKTRVIFQNQTDRNFFLSTRLISPESAELIRGSGVDVGLYYPTQEPQEAPPVILFPGRLLRDKGIFEFIEASRILKDKKVTARFVVVGGLYEANPTSVSHQQFQGWLNEGIIEYWGWSDEMNKVYPLVNIVCLPSYREGLSKTLIEACASGRAIVTTDVPGCRDVVNHGENGLLVPPKNSTALAGALQELILAPQTRQRMAASGRKLAERDFSMQKVIQETFAVYTRAGIPYIL
jgi:glycosyltransferase involved in cell wall biosynthesis